MASDLMPTRVHPIPRRREPPWHPEVTVVPVGLPDTLADLGLCVCIRCRDRAADYLGWSGSESASRVDWTRTERWRSLSWHVGDDDANWLCLWARTRPDPSGELDALLSVADLLFADGLGPIGDGAPAATPVRDALYAYVMGVHRG